MRVLINRRSAIPFSPKLSLRASDCPGGGFVKALKYAAKLHHGGHVLAACDEELLGKTFSEGKFRLTVKKEFYSGKRLVSKEELEGLMEGAEILNLVGEGVIEVAKGLWKDIGGVLKIGGIPHIQILKVITR